MTSAEVEGGNVPCIDEVGCWRNFREEEEEEEALMRITVSHSSLFGNKLFRFRTVFAVRYYRIAQKYVKKFFSVSLFTRCLSVKRKTNCV